MRKLVLILVAMISSALVIGCAAQASAPDTVTPKIVITYSSIVYPDMVPSVLWIGDVPELPSSGTVTAVVNVSIQNLGYDSFESNKDYFSAVVKGTAYAYDSSCYVNDLLADSKMMNGQTMVGNLIFRVPATASASDITLQYTGPVNHEIVWITE